ncbi:hypothetical protein GALMADRAFT_242528 [Galerina marginata CBS 339.88]|uniref:Large ribosomal subunit protein mL59 domain-containing protein n=1 Tax=Galerina marginata (strain CBS 339.88) TaxID=685588 RepID=A0A067TMN7_GALM3|nr:hypothetical protein GALMADRAFT_242528 [Galerina marginata CBS 339.88]
MGTPFQRTAVNAVKRFRTKELAGLMSHLRIFGPLPEPPAQKNKNAKPSIVLPNPFLPKKNPKTGRWRPPKYSLRRQAELVKMAQATGTLNSLPPGPKKFATELRMERVKASLPPADLVNLTTPASATNPAKKRKSTATVLQELEIKLATMKGEEAVLKEDLKRITAEYDLGELTTFEGRTGEGKEAEDQRLKQYIDQVGRRQQKERNEADLSKLEKAIESTQARALSVRGRNMRKREKQKSKIAWHKQVVWAGEGAPKKVPGTGLGTRLYTGKRRMFKGHLWERKRARKVRRHTILMRDMPARIARYKNYYKKRRPNPLKPSRYTKPPKLPY